MIGNSGRPGDPSPGSSHLHKWGQALNISTQDATAGQIIWPIKATVQQYLFLDAAIELFVKSTDGNDDVDSGSGARTIKLFVHDENGEEQEVIKDLQGVANQSLGLSFGVFRMSIETSGAGQTNAGQIQVVDGSANIYATIEIGEGQTQIAVVRCPNDKKGRVIDHQIEFGKTGVVGEALMRLRLRKIDGTIITKWDPKILGSYPKDNKPYGIFGGIPLEAGEFIYWECIDVSQSSTPIRGSIHAEFQDC